MHVHNLLWIVVEDGVETSKAIERLLVRTGIEYVYIAVQNTDGLPGAFFQLSFFSFLSQRFLFF